MTDDVQQEETGRRLIASRMPMNPAIAREYDLEAAQWRVLVEAIWPNAKTPEAIMMALSYCRVRNLDPFKKPVHIVPMWSTAAGKEIETVWPGIAELRTTASRTTHYAGIDPPVWGDTVKLTFKGIETFWEDRKKREREATVTLEVPEWCRRTLYRMVDGQRVPFTAEVWWEEAYATLGFKNELPNEMWRRRKHGQLDKATEASGLRMAFPEEIGGQYAAEEMEGRVLHDVAGDDPAQLFTPAATQRQAASARPAGGPPPAPTKPAALPAPSQQPMETVKTPDPEPRGDGARDDTGRYHPAPAHRPGAQRPGQDFVDPEKVMADATNRFASVEDGDADGWFNVWRDFIGFEEKLLPIDWVDLTDLAQRHYDRTHDDGGKVADSGEVVKE